MTATPNLRKGGFGRLFSCSPYSWIIFQRCFQLYPSRFSPSTYHQYHLYTRCPPKRPCLLADKAPALILFFFSKVQLYYQLRHADHGGVDFTAKLRGGRPAARSSLTVACEQSSSEGAYCLTTIILLQSVLPAPALPSSPPPTSDCSETTPSWVGKGRM